MRSTIYDSMVRDFATLADTMNRLFEWRMMPYNYERNGGSTGESAVQGRTVWLPLDVWATDDAFHIQAYVPGIRPEDVEITWNNDELIIRGQFPPRQEGDRIEYYKQELFHGAFERRLGFNLPVDAEHIEATFENGLLTLTVPKAESIRPKQIKVQAR
ncbi:Hsp20/alpha crystallin family protein [Litorilinea aerophila]|uniref:Hsp20/alpha crystallin family protein n=1 Tax=Litorilinea aerophila TaxID=1204385 RepID=A0A540VE08_9CHLR|nr:Hsp20/alpha crystallin family protein [Litorilinea aerophila]MCC9077320.1 Hsp20/alpha crystallin family protein [Litorilinea aerophila]GIV79433.1 MAG: molecular chaperone Hsp20 [Litorilinea sp.]